MMANILFNFMLAICVLTSCTDNNDKHPVSIPTGKSHIESDLPEKLKDKLVDFDADKNLYQIRVLHQKPSECSAHQERNLLFMVDMLNDSLQEFDKKYEKLMSESAYEDLMSNVVCLLVKPSDLGSGPRERAIPKAGETRIRMHPDLEKLVTENKNYELFLPKKSNDYLKDIVSFSSWDNSENYTKIKKLAKEELPKIESDLSSLDTIIDDVSIYYDKGYHATPVDFSDLTKFVQKLSDGSDFIIPLALGHLSTGTINHATALVVRKRKDKTDIIFMDPLNWKFSQHATYKRILEPLTRIFSSSDYAKQTLIRAGYLYLLLASKEKAKQEERARPFFHFLAAIEKLQLLKDQFFQKTYKKPFCDLIQSSFTVVFQSEEILQPPPYLPYDARPSYPDAKKELLKGYGCEE